MLSRFTVAAAFGAALVLTVTGCGPAASEPTAATPSTPQPAAVLAAAVAKTTGISLKFVLAGDKPDESLSGTYDSVHKISVVTQGAGADAISVTSTTEDLYLANFLPGQTLHAQAAKLSSTSGLTVLADPLAELLMLTAVASVRSADLTTFTGKLNATTVRGSTVGTQKFLEHVVTSAGTKAGAIPFTAKINGQGYLTEFDTTLPNFDDGKDSQFTATFSDFGAQITNQTPTGPKVVEAPADFYAAA